MSRSLKLGGGVSTCVVPRVVLEGFRRGVFLRVVPVCGLLVVPLVVLERGRLQMWSLGCLLAVPWFLS